MRSLILVCGLCLLAACLGHRTMMTRENYDDINLGATISQVTAVAGDPYSIHSKGDGTEEYEYIERIDMGRELVSENHYYIIFRNGQVVGKREKSERPPAYDLIYQCDPNFTY